MPYKQIYKALENRACKSERGKQKSCVLAQEGKKQSCREKKSNAGKRRAMQGKKSNAGKRRAMQGKEEQSYPGIKYLGWAVDGIGGID